MADHGGQRKREIVLGFNNAAGSPAGNYIREPRSLVGIGRTRVYWKQIYKNTRVYNMRYTCTFPAPKNKKKGIGRNAVLLAKEETKRISDIHLTPRRDEGAELRSKKKKKNSLTAAAHLYSFKCEI